MKIKPELTGNRVMECLKLKKKSRREGKPLQNTPLPRPQSYAPVVYYYLSVMFEVSDIFLI